MQDQYRTPTSDIVTEALNDPYYNEGLIEAIPNGLRIYNQFSGCVTDYLRAGETEWNANLYGITSESKSYDQRKEALATLKLATAVAFAAAAPPAPNHSLLVTVHVKTDDEQETRSPAAQILAAFRHESHRILREYEYRDLLRRVPTLDLKGAGGAIPFQAEGKWDGYEFYFRYRGGTASLKIGTPDDVIGEPLWSASMEYGHYLNGSLNTEEFTYLFCSLARNLTRAPFRYTFYDKNLGPTATTTHWRADGTPYYVQEQHTGWGMNPWDARRYAYERNIEYRRMYEEAAAEEGIQGRFREINLLDLTTDDVDNRVYPAVRPPFTVLEVPEPTTPFSLPDDDEE